MNQNWLMYQKKAVCYVYAMLSVSPTEIIILVDTIERMRKEYSSSFYIVPICSKRHLLKKIYSWSLNHSTDSNYKLWHN